MKTYHENKADTALTVKSIKVLENIEGGGITEIRHDVNAVRQQQIAQDRKQDAYWEALSSDGIVSAVEKQGLLREMENITRSEAAILAQAAALGYQGRILQDFIATYEDLRDYLYVTLKLFDDMNEDTAIDDRATFNTKFSQYYFEENFVLLAITAGILDTINFRVLQSLNERGTEGETAIYRGGLYQYVNGVWKNVTTGAYKGPRTELPESEEGAFFIVSESFTMTDVLYVNDEELYVNNDAFGIMHTYEKGMIYYCKEGVWYVEENLSDWKYAAAFADVINITGELPGIFQDAIDNLQEQINRIPSYLGASASIPANPKTGDCFCYIGNTSGTWIKSMLYRYENNAWQFLDPEDTANRQFYMLALEDILASQAVGPGYFSTIFAYAFFGNAATLQSLAVRTIYLSEGGYIQSEHTQYSPNQQGLRIDNDGNIDANGNTHIGKNCNIDGATTIGGSCSITGNTTILGNTIIGNNAMFRGEIESGPLKLTNNTPAPAVVTYPYGTIFNNQNIDELNVSNVDGTYGYVQFDRILAFISGSGGGSITYIQFFIGNVKVYEQMTPGTFTVLQAILSYTTRIPASSKTFKLIDIPTARPAEPNMVYVENGILKLS